MFLAKSNIAPVTAGAIFGAAALLFIDGIALAHAEPMKAHRFSFTMCIPAIFTMIGFLLFMLVSPDDIKEDKRKAKVVLFVAWIAMFGSTVAALTIVFFCFTGKQQRERAAPGVELVLFTAVTPVASSLLWRSRSSEGNDDDW